MLELKHICKSYGRNCVVKDVSVTLGDGESLVLAGESGSGKTTLSKVAVGMVMPDSGSVILDGKILATSNCKRSFQDCVSIQYIFQDPYSALEPGFTLRKTLAETSRICQRHNHPCLSAEEALAYVDADLLRYLDRPIQILSGGQRQKVCIARALMPSPRVIIADESAAMLDRRSGRDIFDLLHRIREERGISLLAILHDVDFSDTKWDRIAVMWQGELVLQAGFRDFAKLQTHAYSRDLVSAYTFFHQEECYEK